MPDDPNILPSSAPVTAIDPDKQEPGPQPGMALCLSGGGYRAMVFHLGAFLRLNELRLLKDLRRISSVSGGSIAAAILGMNWSQLKAANWSREALLQWVINPARNLANETIDADAIIWGALTPGTISDKIVKAYDKHLFQGKTLQDLPSDAEGPRFVINATNVQTGVLWRFSRPYMADYLVGLIPNPNVSLALAVAASSAFPPVLSPASLKVDPESFATDGRGPLFADPYNKEVVLSDGGVYDNLGLETAWKRFKTVLVSDGGGKMDPEKEPKTDWARHAYRIFTVVDNQVRSLRKRQLIDSYKHVGSDHDGAYWGIRSDMANYKVPNPLPCLLKNSTELAEIPTRLKKLPALTQERLINWGYAICDAALRKHVVANGPAPKFPYEKAGV